MNAIDDNYEPEDLDRDHLARQTTRRRLSRAAHVCMCAAFLALPMAIADPNGWWLTAAVAGVAMYLALSHFAATWGELRESAR